MKKISYRNILLLLAALVSFAANANRNPSVKPSGTLPILYINIYGPDGKKYNDELLDINLDHTDYLDAQYWLDINGCTWVDDPEYKSIGSKDAPLETQIKARGNYTRLCFNKKPFKLKLGKKQNLLGLTPEKSKHYALLAHADDDKGFMRNFIAFRLGERIGLPWTPKQQPVELVINGDYRGMYFLTESIRVGGGRIPIEELKDDETEQGLLSGGYVIELDNTQQENQFTLKEKVYTGKNNGTVMVTFEAPESYSPNMLKFVKAQFTAINNGVGLGDERLWSYVDLDDAAKYYLVCEICSHTEAYKGSTYMFRDRGVDKWHFSPLWDFGHAFEHQSYDYFYNNTMFQNLWIESICAQDKFQEKVQEIWLWFMKSCYNGMEKEIKDYVDQIRGAVPNDRDRWKNEPKPDWWNARTIANNRDIDSKRDYVLNFLNQKINFLKWVYGDYNRYGLTEEPEKDDTPPAALPDYVLDKEESAIDGVITDSEAETEEYYTLQGIRIAEPAPGELVIVRRGDTVTKEIIR